jgi:hypothetical protein
MKSMLIRMLTAGCGMCWSRTAAGCKPKASNIQEPKYCCLTPHVFGFHCCGLQSDGATLATLSMTTRFGSGGARGFVPAAPRIIFGRSGLLPSGGFNKLFRAELRSYVGVF